MSRSRLRLLAHQELNFYVSERSALPLPLRLFLLILLVRRFYFESTIRIQSRQTANYSSSLKNISTCPNCPSVGCLNWLTDPQLVSAPLNPIQIAQHFRRSHQPCEHSRGQHIYCEKNNAKQN